MDGPPTLTKRRGWALARRRLALLGFGLLLLLLLLEVGLRILGYRPVGEAPFRFSPTKGWEPRPGAGELNALGFRGPAVALAKPEGVRRVVVVGDSFTYGLGVREEETFPRVLERRLRDRRPDRAIEVVNAGVPGYGTQQEAIDLEERVLPLAPDRVLLAIFLNDADAWSPPYPGWIGRIAYGVRRSSAISLFLRGLPVRLRFGTLGYRSEMDLGTAASLGSAEDPAWRECRASLARIARDCRSREVPLSWVLWPHLRLLREYPFEEAHRAFARAAEEEGLRFLDLRSAFESLDPRTLLVSEGNPHPNADAHRRAAEAIEAWFEDP